MLAYVFWHRPVAGVAQDAYEQALERFHRSLAHRPPSGFRGSGAFRVTELPWLDGGGGYEDWYLVEDWGALGVLEEAAVSRGRLSAHDAAAAHAGAGTAAVYRLLEGSPASRRATKAVWVRPAALGHKQARLGELLGDGMDPEHGGLWRRCLVLGPAPEFCVVAACPPAGVGALRLPHGWQAITSHRVVLCSFSLD